MIQRYELSASNYNDLELLIYNLKTKEIEKDDERFTTWCRNEDVAKLEAENKELFDYKNKLILDNADSAAEIVKRNVIIERLRRLLFQRWLITGCPNTLGDPSNDKLFEQWLEQALKDE